MVLKVVIRHQCVWDISRIEAGFDERPQTQTRHTRMRTHMYACMHADTHACMFVCMHACMYVCVYVCMYVCVCVCICILMYCFKAKLLTYLERRRRCSTIVEKRQNDNWWQPNETSLKEKEYFNVKYHSTLAQISNTSEMNGLKYSKGCVKGLVKQVTLHNIDWLIPGWFWSGNDTIRITCNTNALIVNVPSGVLHPVKYGKKSWHEKISMHKNENVALKIVMDENFMHGNVIFVYENVIFMHGNFISMNDIFMPRFFHA